MKKIEYTKEALDSLVKLANNYNADASASVRLEAARLLLEYGYPYKEYKND